MKLRKIIIFSLLFVAVVTACNEPETPVVAQRLSNQNSLEIIFPCTA